MPENIDTDIEANTDNPNSGLLRRAFMFLEDKEWKNADQYADNLLDAEPENPDAYLCKLLSEFRVSRKEMLSEVSREITGSKNYKNALKFDDASQKEFLERCASEVHARVVEQERLQTEQKAIKTFSDLIDSHRRTQQFNRKMIKRGKSAVIMYLVTYIIFLIYLPTVIVLSKSGLGGETVSMLLLALGLGLGIPLFLSLLWVGHARIERFWDLDYRNDRGWIFPFFYGMVNTFLTLGIMGVFKSVRTMIECNKLSENIDEMDSQIRDFQRQIDEKKALIQ